MAQFETPFRVIVVYQLFSQSFSQSFTVLQVSHWSAVRLIGFYFAPASAVLLPASWFEPFRSGVPFARAPLRYEPLSLRAPFPYDPTSLRTPLHYGLDFAADFTSLRLYFATDFTSLRLYFATAFPWSGSG